MKKSLRKILEPTNIYLSIGMISILILIIFSNYKIHFILLLGMIIGFKAFIISMFFKIDHRLNKQKVKLKELEKIIISAGASTWFTNELKPSIVLPYYSGWSLHSETASYVVRKILDEAPNNIIEIGSGMSTLLIAYALEKNNNGFVWSIEQDNNYSQETIKLLRIHNLEHRAKIITAPLSPLLLKNWRGDWYDQKILEKYLPNTIDYLLIDGPPYSTETLARYPALPIFGNMLTNKSVIILDDAKRKDELTISQRWESEGYTINTEILPIGKGVAVANRAN